MLSWAAALELIKKVWPYIAGAALLLAVYLYVDHKGYERAQKKYQLDISQMETAGAQATAESWKQKYEQERRYAEEAKKADDSLAATRDKYNAALLRYAQSGAGKAGASSSTGVSSGSNGPGGSPKLPYESVIIPYEDASICATNTARLQTVREWALSVLADQLKKSEAPSSPSPSLPGSTP